MLGYHLTTITTNNIYKNINFYTGWWANPLNPSIRGGLSRVVKFLTHQKVSQVELINFKSDPWWASPCELGWLLLTCLVITKNTCFVPCTNGQINTTNLNNDINVQNPQQSYAPHC